MPSARRVRTASAVSDVELSDWAADQGFAVSPSRIQAWRCSGLVVSPSVPRKRPAGAPPGRHASDYEPQDLGLAREAVAFLAVHARRGRSHRELAVRLFAAGLPVRHDALLAGLQAQLDGALAEVSRAARRAVAGRPTQAVPGWEQSDAARKAEAMAADAVSTGSVIGKSVRDGLRRSGVSGNKDEVITVLTLLLSTMFDEPPDADDVEGNRLVLQAFGAEGLVEPVSDGGPVVVPEGPGGLANALSAAVGQGLFDVPDNLALDELVWSRNMAQLVFRVHDAIPDEFAHYLGGEALAGVWQPEEPLLAAQTLVHLVKLRRAGLVDFAPMYEAAVIQGWLTERLRDRETLEQAAIDGRSV